MTNRRATLLALAAIALMAIIGAVTIWTTYPR